MVLFLQLASYLSSSLSALIHLVPSAIEASVSARRIMSVLELPREQLDHPERAQRLVREGVPLTLSLQGLEFSYQGRAPVLKQLDLQVQPHEMIAIVGPSGSGKTTLFRLLLGLLHPTDGSAVLTGGGEALDVSPSTRCCFAYVPQDNVIFSGTVAETLRLVRPGRPGGGPVGCAARRLRRGFRPRPARRAGLPAARTRRLAVRGAEPAAGHCARHSGRCSYPAARRGDVGA